MSRSSFQVLPSGASKQYNCIVKSGHGAFKPVLNSIKYSFILLGCHKTASILRFVIVTNSRRFFAGDTINEGGGNDLLVSPLTPRRAESCVEAVLPDNNAKQELKDESDIKVVYIHLQLHKIAMQLLKVFCSRR